jgi:hypothetical protein
MWATARSGAILPKDAAAEWALSRLPLEHQPILELARLEYRGERATDWTCVRADVQAFVTRLRQILEEHLRHPPAGAQS